MGLMAGPLWDFQLSAPTTIVYQYHQQRNDVRKAVELAIHVAYLHGFGCFYHLGSTELDELISAPSPLLKMFQLAKAKFKDVPFGNFLLGCVSPLAIKYKDVFLN
jgi:hypothetical protein